MKKILLAILFISAGLLQAQNDTIYVMKGGVVIQQHSIKLADVDSIIFYNPLISNIQTALIPAGTFTMGSSIYLVYDCGGETQHQVTLSAFRIGKYEITNAQYATFLNAKRIGSNGLYPAGRYINEPLIRANSTWGLTYSNSKWSPVAGYEASPVIKVSWYGAMEFAAFVGGTLPTEAQWEYACRGGTTTPYSTGDNLSYLQANYDWAIPYSSANKNAITVRPGKPLPVGTYAPNAYGLYDMHGNVREWCVDWLDTYPTSAQTNPVVTVCPAGSNHVLRGGCWYDSAGKCRSGARSSFDPSYQIGDNGFRVVFVP